MLEVLVVIFVVSISSENVTAMVELTETEVAESAREDEETVGDVVSVSVAEGGNETSSPLSPTSLLHPR